MKKNVLKFLTILFFATICYNVFSQQLEKEVFVHSVYFWLKNPTNIDDRTLFETSLKKFINESKFAREKFIGTPAGTQRSVVDNSYDYCLIVTFNSKEDQDKYQKEPAHLQFIKEAKHLWEEVIIYDAIKSE
jgi:hypothetical protein